MSSQEQDSIKTPRRSLKTLQHTASDNENLVGRPSISLKHQLSQETAVDVEVKSKDLPSKETQATIENKVTEDDLTNPDGASENYWRIIAEKRRIALQDTLDENEKLHQIIDDLKKRNEEYKLMLEEANSFLEVIKEELGNSSNNDTGIDVNDVSTADTTVEGASDEETTTSSKK